MRLYLVRHPEPVVEPETCYGSSDLGAKPEQCARVCASLLASLPKDVSIFSSPSRRCAELAEKLARGLGQQELVFDQRLADIDYGYWELQPWSAIPHTEIDAWVKDVVNYRPGGGESMLQMAARVRAFHEELLLNPCAAATVICHAGTVRMLMACQRGLTLDEMARYGAQVRHRIAFGETILLDI
jgi:alpha-ribazole phosphatase